MTVIEPVNTQQVIQMGSHTEKLQQTIQQQPSVLAQQLQEEHLKQTELLKTEVQDTENTQPDEFSEPDSETPKSRHRKRSKVRSSLPIEEDRAKNALRLIEKPGGDKINIIA